MVSKPKPNPVVRRLMAGLLAVAPLAVTWFILSFLFNQLSHFGRPLVIGLSRALQPTLPEVAAVIRNETVLSIIAVFLILLFLYLLGWLAGRLAGRRLIAMFDALAQRIPVVDTIYRATKGFIAVANTGDGKQAHRVVLINFPSPEMKTIGLLTHTLRDSHTGEELAAVYVPTTPNPTSGYLEILPVNDLTFTDWSFDQAMAFIVTAGSNAPATIAYRGRGIPENESVEPE